MAELEPRQGMTDVPLPPDDNGEEAAPLPPSQEEPLPDTPDGWAKRLGSLDFYKDHKRALVVLGVAALAVGAVYAKRHDGSKVFVHFADRHAEKEGVISLGEAVEYGAAIAVPTRAEADASPARSAAAKLLFAMTGEPGEVVRPAGGSDEQTSKYNEVAGRAAGWLREHFSAQAGETR